MLNNNGRDKRGAKQKTPNSALDALLFENKISTYYLQKNGIMNAGYVHNKAKRNVKGYTIAFLMKLSKAVHMNWIEVAKELLRLQQTYPPLIAKDHRRPNTNWNKRHKENK